MRMYSAGARFWLCLSVLLWSLCAIQPGHCMTKERRLELRDEVKQVSNRSGMEIHKNAAEGYTLRLNRPGITATAAT